MSVLVTGYINTFLNSAAFAAGESAPMSNDSQPFRNSSLKWRQTRCPLSCLSFTLPSEASLAFERFYPLTGVLKNVHLKLDKSTDLCQRVQSRHFHGMPTFVQTVFFLKPKCQICILLESQFPQQLLAKIHPFSFRRDI